MSATDGAGAVNGSPQQQAQMTATQQMPPQVSTPVQSVAQPNVGGDSLICQWSSCGERCGSAELLYVSRFPVFPFGATPRVVARFVHRNFIKKRRERKS
ncbi:MAG: hypothetical protein INR71_12555 [Terriglobus roseus]|nr:hypothetical protein [Terriglobus roseus]